MGETVYVNSLLDAPLSSDMTVYAKWRGANEAPEFAVTFETNGGTAIASGSYAVIETAPESQRNGYTFEGWYTDADLGAASKITFPYTVTGATTLYAKWMFTSGTEGLTYELQTSTGSYTVTGYYGADKVIRIPEIYRGKPVTGIDAQAFLEKTAITEVYVHDGVTSIGDYAFQGCSSLTSIVIPNSVTSIGSYAFLGCSSLTSIVIPNSVTYISDDAFSGCSSLTSITIGNGVTSIGTNAFEGCDLLSKVEISDVGAWCRIKFGNIYSNPLFYAHHLYVNGAEVTELVIPNSVTSIGDYAFSGCSSLTSIIIPNSVTSIGYSAFSSCRSLTSIVIPNSVTSIGYRAFEGCSTLTSIVIPDSVTSIGSGAFYGTTWYVNQPDGVVYAGKVLYKYKGTMPSNTRITVKEGTLGITAYAFSYCSSLTSIIIPNSVTSIGDWAFSDCRSLTSIVIPNSVTSIGSEAFYGTAWYVNQPDGVVYAGKVLYSYKGTMPSNTRITVKEGTLGIAGGAFSDCSTLMDIVIPNSVTSIGVGAFYNCSSLTSMVIPDSVTSIGNEAFSGCSSLTSIVYGGTIAEWKAITKESRWNYSTGNYTVKCTNGTLTKAESES